MLRALVVSFAMLAVSLGSCAAETTARAVDTSDATSNEVSNQHPDTQSKSAAGSGSGEDFGAENELLQAANKSRELGSVPLLRMDESLHAAALAHALRMVASERLEHQFSGEPALMQRITLVSPVRLDRAGENVAYADSARDVNQALMRSPPHRENLLDRGFDVAGIAAVWSKGRLYVVQDFAHQMPSYTAEQSEKLVGRAVGEIRQQAGLSALVQLTPPNLDEAACSLARENAANAHLLATAYNNEKIITYTQSRPEILPQAAVSMLRDPSVRQFAVGACYARNAAYPAGTYWVAILLY